MATDKQLKANRANARKSMGPRSQEGKARSRRNSRKHGLTATTLVTGYEDPGQFEELRDELMTEHDPQSALECELVERLAVITWRQRRVPVFEAAILQACQAEAAPLVVVIEGFGRPDEMEDRQNEATEDRQSEATKTAESAQKRAIKLGKGLIGKGAAGSDALGKLARYEAFLMNAFAKTLQMLLLLQDNRRKRKDEPLMLRAV